MLAMDFPGAPELRAQVASTLVSGRCACGCPSVDLVVEGDVRPASVTSRTPVNAEVDGVVGGGLIVFVDDGRLPGRAALATPLMGLCVACDCTWLQWWWCLGSAS